MKEFYQNAILAPFSAINLLCTIILCFLFQNN